MAKREERQKKAIAKHNILSVKNLAPRNEPYFLDMKRNSLKYVNCNYAYSSEKAGDKATSGA